MIKTHLKNLSKAYMNLLGIVFSKKTQLKPLKDLEKLSPNLWLSLSEDPHFFVKSKPLTKGWYLLVLKIETAQHQTAKLYPVYKDTPLAESTAIELPLKPHKAINRFFYLEKPPDFLRFDPQETEGGFRIKKFRLIKVPYFYALRHQLIRIQNLNNEFNQFSTTQLSKLFKKRAQQKGTLFYKEVLEAYKQTFAQKNTTVNYHQWLEKHEKIKIQRFLAHKSKVESENIAFSIILPTYNTDPQHLKICIKSVINQTHNNWQLCIIDDASTQQEHLTLIKAFAEKDPRITFNIRAENGHFSKASNDALAMCSHPYTLLLDHDDVLSPHALQLFTITLLNKPNAQLLYADEDKIDEAEFRFMPHFKPDWNPDLLYSQNYIGHPVVYKTEKLKEIGGFREGVEGSQDHDLLLRYSQNLNANQIEHLPWILYHWRATENSTALNIDSKNYTTQAGIKSLQDFFDSQNKNVKVKVGHYPNTYRCQWPLPKKPPLVSLLIPTRDGYQILKNAVDSILEKTHYSNYEILILNNQSKCQQTLDYLKELGQKHTNIRILDWHHPFNYSAINNFGVEKAEGEIIGLINNDIEVINEKWLTEMVSHAIRPDIGCVGAKLYYPDNTIQHAGVILGIGGVAGHAHKYFSKENPGYFSRLHLTQNYSAVTAACLLVKKSIYKQVNGLDEVNLTVAFNDVEFCIKVREAGYRNLFTPWAELYHHESISRGAEDTLKKIQRFSEEVKFMKEHWYTLLRHDPAYNRNLSLTYENFTLKNN